MFVCKTHSKKEMRWCFDIPMCTSDGLCEVCATEGPCVDLPGHLITTEPDRRTLGDEADAAGMTVDEYVHRDK